MEVGYRRSNRIDSNIVFGANLRRLMKEAGLTNKTLSQRLSGFDKRQPQTIQSWVSVRSQPDYSTLVAIADQLSEVTGRHVSLDEFFDRQPK